MGIVPAQEWNVVQRRVHRTWLGEEDSGMEVIAAIEKINGREG